MEINLEYSVDETNKVVEGNSFLRDNPIQFQILTNSYKNCFFRHDSSKYDTGYKYSLTGGGEDLITFCLMSLALAIFVWRSKTDTILGQYRPIHLYNHYCGPCNCRGGRGLPLWRSSKPK